VAAINVLRQSNSIFIVKYSSQNATETIWNIFKWDKIALWGSWDAHQ